MKDEVKEINIPENVLVALGDLTNGALNYYKATETIKVRHNTILDYITNLQEENERLAVELNKNMIERNNYLSRNKKAVEYNKKNIKSQTLNNILQGEDKE